MPCYHPLRAFQNSQGGVVFREVGDIVRTLDLPCGQCIGCRLERSRQWATRIMHEASLHDDNCWLTLTFDDEHLPDVTKSWYRPFQLFMYRLRWELRPRRIRFFVCGE